MTAAIYARRAGKSVLVFETMVCGGQIVNTTRIENWPGDFGVSGTGLTKKIFKQMEELGAEIKYETVMDVEKYKDEGFVIKTEETEYLAKTVILAVGTEDRKMELKREEELLGRGISYCATCDGNASLTVRAHQANSHSTLGWQKFTDAAIQALAKQREHIVYMLWGGYARSKAYMIDKSRNLVLESVHPSPLSANRGGWFGQHQFSRCNAYLEQNGQTPILW